MQCGDRSRTRKAIGKRSWKAIVTCDNFLYGVQGRTFGAPGLTAPAVDSQTGVSNRRERAARVTRRKRLRFNRGTRRCGAARFARVLRTQALRTRRRAAHGTPGDRPPAVPAVSRCRARQHHDQADSLAPGAPIAGRMSQPPGRNAAHCPGRPLQRQGHPDLVSNRFAETRSGTHP